MAEAKFLLELLVRLFADPARLDRCGETTQRCAGWQIAEIVLALAIRAPLTDQPSFLARRMAVVVKGRAVADPDTDRGKPRRQGPLRAASPAHPPPPLPGQDLFSRARFLLRPRASLTPGGGEQLDGGVIHLLRGQNAHRPPQLARFQPATELSAGTVTGITEYDPKPHACGLHPVQLGQSNLAYMYENGLGVAADEMQAVYWLRKSADLGDAYAQCALGEKYEYGKGIAKDLAQAQLLYTQAAEQGDSRAAYMLGMMYENGRGVSVDYFRASEWYRKAADKGYAWAQLEFGLLYAEGRGVERDYKQAVDWFRKAAEQGNAVAQNNLGYAYEAGLGVEVDATEARQWYIRAANQGHEGAKARLNPPANAVTTVLKRAIEMMVQ